MGLMGMLSSLTGGGAGQQIAPEQHASVVQGLLQHFGNQPGGMAGLANQFRSNGMGQHVDGWMNTQPGQQPQALQPHEVEQGMGPEGIQQVAQHAGVNPEMAKMALAVALPMLMSHLSQGSGQLPNEASTPGGLGMGQGLLSNFF